MRSRILLWWSVIPGFLLSGPWVMPGFAQEESIELRAVWAPFTDSLYKFGERWKTLQELRPAEEVKAWSQSELACLLPPQDAEFGELWRVDVVPVMTILSQLHEGVTHTLHHGGPRGAWGMIVAKNDSIRRIRLRIHAEFRLPDGYYVPSQFAGDVIQDRSSGQIVALRLAVPPRHNNVDLNWETGEEVTVGDREGNPILDENGEPMKVPMTMADIGYCAQLELAGGDWQQAERARWDRILPDPQIERSLQRKFYKFAEIDWLPWEQAVSQSRETGKPLHVVALFGVLDDESC